MNHFESLERTVTGRPKLLEEELEIFSQGSINLYNGDEKTPYRDGRCVVTSHRIFWIQEKKNIALTLPLHHVQHVTRESGFLQRSGKLSLHLHSNTYIKLSFKEGGRDDFYKPLTSTLKRAAWKDTKKSVIEDKRLEEREFSTANAGIAGIMRRQEQGQRKASDIASQAFEDLDSLMKNAKDVVALVSRYVETSELKAGQEKNGEDQMDSVLLDMGISNPVTRENSGAEYHRELARQLADFLCKPLEKNGGILSLTDVYCMFNRARGTELISPEDLMQAAKLQKPLRVGMHLRQFGNGLLVIQSDSHNEENIVRALEEMIEASSACCVTSSEVSAKLRISLILAKGYLRMAESKGRLCQDDTFEGCSYYLNKFPAYYNQYIQ